MIAPEGLAVTVQDNVIVPAYPFVELAVTVDVPAAPFPSESEVVLIE